MSENTLITAQYSGFCSKTFIQGLSFQELLFLQCRVNRIYHGSDYFDWHIHFSFYRRVLWFQMLRYLFSGFPTSAKIESGVKAVIFLPYRRAFPMDSRVLVRSWRLNPPKCGRKRGITHCPLRASKLILLVISLLIVFADHSKWLGI